MIRRRQRFFQGKVDPKHAIAMIQTLDEEKILSEMREGTMSSGGTSSRRPSADDQLEEIAPQTLANNSLRGRLIAPTVEIEPRDDWERLIIGVGTDCGVSLPHKALSSEGLYE